MKLRRLRLELPRVQATWECDYSYTPLVVGDGSRRPFHAAVAMFVDQASGFIHGSEMGEPPLSEAFVRERLQGAMRQLGARPARLLVRRDFVYAALEPLAEELDLVIERVTRLPALEQAQRAMLAYLTGRQPSLMGYRPGSSIGWPWGVARAAASHSALRWCSSPAATRPFSATSPSSAGEPVLVVGGPEVRVARRLRVA